MHPAFAMPN